MVTRLMIVAMLALLSACGTEKKAHHTASSRSGSYYQNDGPGEHPPSGLDQIADAIPRAEPYNPNANRPYVVLGHEYVPDTSDKPFRQRGIGSWYGRQFHGQRTASGEIYDMYGMTAAHPTLPIPSYARVTNPANGHSVIVRINDRGPFLNGRIIDLSYAAAYKLGYMSSGSAPLELERLTTTDIAAGHWGISPNNPNNPSSSQIASNTANKPVNTAAASVSSNTRSPVSTPVPAVPLISPPFSPPVIPPVIAPVIAPINPVHSEVVNNTAMTVSNAANNISSKPPLPQSAAQAGYFLQLGAFHNQAAAEEFSIRIGWQLEALAERMQINVAGDLYRVQLGPYADRNEAETVASQVRSTLDFKPVLVPVRDNH